jgi:hypothetical protein
MRTVLPLLLAVCLGVLTVGCGGDGSKGKFSGKDVPKPAEKPER